MVTYVLDSSAILRYLDDEPGAELVASIIKSHLAGRCEAVVSSLHWGEIAGLTCKMHGRAAMETVLARLQDFGFPIVSADSNRAVRASLIKLHRKIPYVDAFGIELASDSPEHVLVTADLDCKPASRDVKIEFLPAK